MPEKYIGCRFISGCFFFCLVIFVPQVSANVTKNKKDLNQVIERIENTKKAVKRLQGEGDSLADQLAAIEKLYGEIAKSLKKLQLATTKKQRHLQKIGEQIVEQETEIKNIAQQLQGQIRAAYAMGKMKKLKVLLNQQDPVRSNPIMVYYEYLNRERLEKLELTRQILQDLSQLEDEERLASQKLSQLVEQKQTERTKLTNTRETRAVILAELKKEQRSKAAELVKLKQREAELRRLIASLQAASDEVTDAGAGSRKPFFQQKGLLKWPVNGRLSKKFGSQRGGGQWDGVLIDTKEGTEVRAVAKGRIVYSDWLRGYGFLVIIDHGKSYMTLYAFNQSLFKKEGARVSQGDIIASVGKSGGRIQAGLYFGIRKNGKPLNPVKWCRKVHQGKIR